MILRVLSFLGLAALALAAACGDVTRPIAPAQRQPSDAPPPFPPFTGNGMLYVAPDTTRDDNGGNTTSRIALFGDVAAFSLLFSNTKYGLWVFAGQYSRSDSVLTLTSSDDEGDVWHATAIVRGDSLRLTRHDSILFHLSNGVYRRAPPTAARHTQGRAGSP